MAGVGVTERHREVPLVATVALLAAGCGSQASPTVVRGPPATVFAFDNLALWRYVDLDDDGNCDGPGEQTRFFDKTASPAGFAEVVGLLALDGTTVLATNNSRLNNTIPGVNSILWLHDLDGNGDAFGVGESHPWFSGTLPSGALMTPAQALTLGRDGAIYVPTEADNGGPYTIYRMQDLNGDNDVDDPGEVTTFAEVEYASHVLVEDVAVDTSITWFVSFDGATYPSPSNVYALSGDALEVAIDGTTLAAQTDIAPTEHKIALLADGSPAFTASYHPRLPAVSAALVEVRGGVATLDNVHVIWTQDVDGIAFLFDDFEVLEDGSLVGIERYGDTGGRMMRLVDGNGDGAFMTGGESSLIYDNRIATMNGQTALYQPRAITGSVR
jgi:hypothetical protein